MKKKIIAACLIISIIFPFSACKKGEEDPAFSLRSRTNRLTGEWNVTKFYIDGEDVLNYSESYQDRYDYYCDDYYDLITSGTNIITYEFEKDGDFEMIVNAKYSSKYDYDPSSTCTDYTDSDSEVYISIGEWEFEDKKSELELTYKTGFVTIQEYDIEGLSNKKLTLKGIVDGEIVDIEMEKEK